MIHFVYLYIYVYCSMNDILIEYTDNFFTYLHFDNLSKNPLGSPYFIITHMRGQLNYFHNLAKW